MNRLLELISRAAGAVPDPLYVDARPGDIRFTQADISQAARHLGHVPDVSIQDGIRRTVQWFRDAHSASTRLSVRR